MRKGFFHSLTFRLSALIVATAATAFFATRGAWLETSAVAFVLWLPAIRGVRRLFRRHVEKIAFMFDAIDNVDYSFKYASDGRFSHDALVNRSLNRITRLLLQAKADALQKEKYYELIINSISTGILVIDDKGYVFQTNNEALRMIGLPVFTHVKQLSRVDEALETLITDARAGDKRQIALTNERQTVTLSVRVSEMTLREKHVRIVVINDIHSELDEKEIDSWIRLTRVLTHEIMNSVTPITSLSQTLLSIHGDANPDIRNGLETICSTGKSLISFVDSYRKFTHIPPPKPTLFYVRKFIERMAQLAHHHYHYPNIAIHTDVAPELILHADENLIGQVVLNILKNAMQAIGHAPADGRIDLHACCNDDEAVLIEITNNGPLIPPEEARHIFVPFFTTKEGGSGIGLSVSRQIMRLSGGTIALKSLASTKKTTFVLTFP
jgi:nitrogen fixation/metabolism regulation signal transduction histidine kinase